MGMNKTMVAVTGLLMCGLTTGARADMNEDGTIALTANGGLNVGIVLVNKMKTDVRDVLDQEDKDHKQRIIIGQLIDKRTAEIEKAKTSIKTERQKILNADNAVDRDSTLDGDAKKKKHEDVAKAKENLDKALENLQAAENLTKDMSRKVHSVAGIHKVKERNEEWERIRKELVIEQTKVKGNADAAGTALVSAAATITDILGKNKVEEVGAFKVTLKSWSCKKTEIYLGDAEYPKASKVGDSIGASKDGKFTMHVLIVGSRREQARKYEQLRAKGQGDTANIKVTAASNWILSYEMVSGHKTTDWKVDQETYDWKAPEGKAKVEHKVAGSGKNVKSTTDQIEITFPTDAATNSIHGWVKGEIKWKGAQEEEDTDDCSYDVVVEPKH
jgi:hypothetical protein